MRIGHRLPHILPGRKAGSSPLEAHEQVVFFTNRTRADFLGVSKRRRTVGARTLLALRLLRQEARLSLSRITQICRAVLATT
jgi:hypothetical protein